MKINCCTQFGPLNSEPVFDAFIQSCSDSGDSVHKNRNDDCDVAVIWSVLCRTISLSGIHTGKKINL